MDVFVLNLMLYFLVLYSWINCDIAIESRTNDKRWKELLECGTF
jgi:hypothetical protein